MAITDSPIPMPYRVLIAEDEPLIALDLEGHLRDSGCEIVGPAINIRELQSLSATERLDGAIVDFGLLGPDPVAALSELIRRNVATLIMTGYAEEVCGLHWKDAQRVTKPAHLPDVVDRLHTLILRRRIDGLLPTD